MKKLIRGERSLKPIRALSVTLGILGLGMSFALWGFAYAAPGPPPLFKYAIITLPLQVWSIGFGVAGVLIVAANVARDWVTVAHTYGAFIYLWWGVVLTVATVNPRVVTSGYSLMCLVIGVAHWVCAAYWDWEYERGRQ